MEIPTEITVGPFIFSYEKPGMTVSKSEEAIGYCEMVTPGEWEQFAKVTGNVKPDLPELPFPFIFGRFKVMDYEYVGIAAKPYWEANQHLDDSSTVHSAQPYLPENDEETVEYYLDRATQGILAGEAMESAWELIIPWEDAKAQLEANGMEFVDMSKWDE